MNTGESRIVRRIRAWPRRVSITLATILVLLIGARIALPFVVRHQVNARLQSIPGYSGHVARIGFHLWRGAYSLHGIEIYRLNGTVREPFVRAKDIDFSLAWRELWHRKIVSQISVEEGQIIFVKGSTKEASQTDTDRRWEDVVKDLFPIDITHFELTHGLVRYIDNTREPHADLFITNMHLVATGLRNRADEKSGEFPAQIDLEGETLGAGKVVLSISAEPLATQPHFHLSVTVENVDLPALNDSLRAYAKIDVGRGTFRMAAEMAGQDGGFQGYVKPFFENLDFHNLADENKGIGSRIWEHIVSGLAWLVKNKARDQVATRIPFQGRFGDAKVGLLATIGNLLRHGFIRAFTPTVEGTVNPDKILPSGKTTGPDRAKDGKSETIAPAKR